MIQISDALHLESITLEDQPALFKVMQRIYPPAYAHFWEDQGHWYLDKIYGLDNLTKELQEEGSYYYFVRSYLPANEVSESTSSESNKEFSSEYKTIGILKVIENCPYPEQPNRLGFKIHRIYLDASVHGEGIGKKLMQYAEERAKETNHTLLWLDAMDQHPQAMSFYKNLGYTKGGVQYLDFELLHDIYRPMWYLYKHL